MIKIRTIKSFKFQEKKRKIFLNGKNGMDWPRPCLSDSSLLQDNVAFVLCLDTLGNSDNLHLHVSKPPKEGSPQHALLRELETVRLSAPHLEINTLFTPRDVKPHWLLFLGCGPSAPWPEVLNGPQEDQPGRRHSGVGARALRHPPPARLHPVPPGEPPQPRAPLHHGHAVSVLSGGGGRGHRWVGDDWCSLSVAPS